MINKKRMYLLAAVLTMALTGGSGIAEPVRAEEAAAETADNAGSSNALLQTYENLEGWSVRYDPSLIRAEEGEDGAAFIWTGTGAASGTLDIRFWAERQPEEVLDELTAGWGSGEEISRSEGFFPGTEDRWGYWRSLHGTAEDPQLDLDAFAGEFNGGVLQFLFTVHKSGSEEEDMAVSDALAAVTDTLAYSYFEEQFMYADYSGTYQADGDGPVQSVILLQNHHGRICGEEDTPVIWGSTLLTEEENPAKTRAYSLEGDTLLVQEGDEQLSFTRQHLPAYAYPGPEKLYAAVCAYMTDELGKYYTPEDVCIPCPAIVGTDESNPEDILVWGDFWVYNFDWDGDTLLEKSGGSFPGLIHLRKNGEEYEGVRMDEVSSGADYDQSARSIFGERFDELERIHADDAGRRAREEQVLANYAAANQLPIVQYQEYGREPVRLPEENIESFDCGL